MYYGMFDEITEPLEGMMAGYDFQPAAKFHVGDDTVKGSFRKEGYVVEYMLKVEYHGMKGAKLSLCFATKFEIWVSLRNGKGKQKFFERSFHSNQEPVGIMKRVVPDISSGLARLL